MIQVSQIKGICLLTLSFFIVAFPIASLCLATASVFSAGDQPPDPGGEGRARHDHGHQSSQDHKPPCYKGLLCCPAIVEGTSSYFFVLESWSVASAQIFSHLFEMTELIYHPPETRF